MGTEENENQNGISKQEHGGVTWLDVRDTSKEVIEQLKRDYKLHPVHLTESVQKVQHTQVEREDDYIFLVLHFPLFEAETYKVHIGQIGIFLGRDWLVTIHHTDCPTVEKLFEQCQNRPDLSANLFNRGSDQLLYELIHRLLNNLSEMVDYVQSEMDGLEDKVFGDDQSDALTISKVRQKIVKLSRVIGPKRIILEDLSQQVDGFMDRNVSRYFSNNTKLANRLWEVIDEARETVEIYKDADFTASTERTNRTLMLLTLAFTFTIPVTVVSTMYGMNVPLPGSNSEPWHFLGRYTSAIIIVGASILLTVAMHFYFKAKKWF